MLVPRNPLRQRRPERLHSRSCRVNRDAPGQGRTVVGVIADTHGLLRPEALAALEGVDLIVHAGDIGPAAILDALAAIAPVLAVRGNNDRDDWAAAVPEIVTTTIAGVRLYVVHELKTLQDEPRGGGADVVISGHSHRPGVERVAGSLRLNPGSAGPRRFTLPISVARLRLDAGGARAEIVELDVAAGPARRPRRGGLDAAGGRRSTPGEAAVYGAMKKDISSLRSTLEYLEAAGELVTTDVEVDPHLEVAAIQKHFDGGAALLFNKVKGYPNARICNNIFASAERIAKLLGRRRSAKAQAQGRRGAAEPPAAGRGEGWYPARKW